MPHIFDITNIINTYGYLGIFIIVFLESGIFFILPGDSLLFTAGLLTPVFHFNLSLLIIFIFLATFLGGIFGYEIGFYIEKLRKYSFFKKILKDEHLEKTHMFFNKHGKVALIFCRFVPIVRTFMPIIAGVSKVNYKMFIKYSLISSFLWSITLTLFGYYLGRMFPQIQNYLWVMAIFIIVISLIPILLEIFENHRKI